MTFFNQTNTFSVSGHAGVIKITQHTDCGDQHEIVFDATLSDFVIKAIKKAKQDVQEEDGE